MGRGKSAVYQAPGGLPITEFDLIFPVRDCC